MKNLILISAVLFSTISLAQEWKEDFEWIFTSEGYSSSRKLSVPRDGWILPSGTYTGMFTYINTSMIYDTAYIVSRHIDKETMSGVKEFIKEANIVLSDLLPDEILTFEGVTNDIRNNKKTMICIKGREDYQLIGVVLDGNDLVLEVHRQTSNY